MTLKEAKDIIAVKNGHHSWESWSYTYSEPYGKEVPSKYLEEACELYATSQYKKGYQEAEGTGIKEAHEYE